MQVRGVEDGDDRDGKQVVDDGQREQERAQRGGQRGADDGEHGQGEGDVGRGRDRPAGEVPGGGAGVDRDEHQSRQHHAADRGGDGQHGPARITQVAGDELPFELQAGDEEEDRQQPVGGPLGQREIEVQRGRPDADVGHGGIGLAPRAVRPHERENRRADQERTAHGLGSQNVCDPADLRPAAAREQPGHGSRRRGGHRTPSWIDGRTADQASRHTAVHATGTDCRPPSGMRPRRVRCGGEPLVTSILRGVAKEVARRRSPVDAVLGRPAAAVVAGFALAVGIGTFLLMLPVATEDRTPAGLVTALFTTVSAVCVTGLVVVDTATFWSEFGQLVILVLIQVGGFGIMTLATLLGLLIARRVGLRMQLTAQAETKALGLGDVRRVVVGVLAVSLIIEAVTAVILAARFALFYAEPPLRAVYLGVFHAVSAFNNAGFALLHRQPDRLRRRPVDLPADRRPRSSSAASASRCCSSCGRGCGAARRGGRCTPGSRSVT